MRKTTLFIMLLVAGCFLLFQTAGAQDRKHYDTTMSIDGEKKITDCSQIRMRIRGGEAIRSQLVQVSTRWASALEVHATMNVAVHVPGGGGNNFVISACLGVAGDSSNDAKAVLDQVRLSIRYSKVLVQGPNRQDWLAYLIIQAPNGSALDLEAGNGPIGIVDFSGQITARNINRPLTCRNVNGQVKADVQNGPLTVAGSGGDFQWNVENGPLTVALDGVQWSGGELEGRAQNGPLTLKLPENYVTAVRIDASKQSPIECRAVQCKQAVRTWDRPSVIEFGSGTPQIRLSTVNGPVTIVTPGAK